MLFERIVAEGLAHNSYLIGSGGRAVVIDPRRDCDVYLEIARRNNLAIMHIIETHRNEDYVTGSLDLKEMTGAEILHGAHTAFGYVRKGRLMGRDMGFPSMALFITSQ